MVKNCDSATIRLDEFKLKNRRMRYLFLLLLFGSSCLCAQVVDSSEQLLIVPTEKETTLFINDTTRVLEADSIRILEQTDDDYPNPKRAATLGLLIPGAGHIYNKKGWYWKLPIVYGGIGAGVYFLNNANTLYNLYDDIECYKIINASQELIPEESRCFKHLQLVEGSTPELPEYEFNPDALSNASKRRLEIFQGFVERDQFSRQAMRSRRDLFDKQRQLISFGIIAGHLVLNGAWPFVDAHLRNFDLNDDLTLRFRPIMQNVALSATTFTGVSAQLEF